MGAVLERRVMERYSAPRVALLATVGGLLGIGPPLHGVTVENVRYTTQDRGVSTQSTMTLAYPVLHAASRPVDVLLLLHGTSGFRTGCGWSNDAATRFYAAVLASYGYVVAMPDYLGLESPGGAGLPYHPYLVGEATALASVDAARAALRVAAQVPLPVRARVLAWGESQGGVAVLWLERFLPYYGREFVFAGGVAVVPPSHLVEHVWRGVRDEVPATPFSTAALAAMTRWYSAPAPSVFTPDGATQVDQGLQGVCDVDGLPTSPSAFAPWVAEQAHHTEDASGWLPCALRENSLLETSVPHGDGQGAILFALGARDTLVDGSIERAAFEALRKQPHPIPMAFLQCAGATHMDMARWSLPEALSFLADRADGKPAAVDNVARDSVVCRGTPLDRRNDK